MTFRSSFVAFHGLLQLMCRESCPAYLTFTPFLQLLGCPPETRAAILRANAHGEQVIVTRLQSALLLQPPDPTIATPRNAPQAPCARQEMRRSWCCRTSVAKLPGHACKNKRFTCRSSTSNHIPS
jgi:hypothetical protein